MNRNLERVNLANENLKLGGLLYSTDQIMVDDHALTNQSIGHEVDPEKPKPGQTPVENKPPVKNAKPKK